MKKFTITAFIAGLGVQSKDLMFSISMNPQASMAEGLAKAEKYINGEEALISKKESSSTHKEKNGTNKQRGRSTKRQSNQEGSPKKSGERSPKRRGNLRDRLGPPQFERRRRYSPQRFTSLTASVSQVLREVRNEQFLRWPIQMKSDPSTRDNTKYCEFHRDHGHRTDNCIQLKREIEFYTARVPQTLHILRKSASESGSEPSSGSIATTTASSDDNLAPATPWRNPSDLGRICRRGRI